MIAGGKDPPNQHINTSYILAVNLNGNSITEIYYKNLPDVPHSFGLASFGNFKGRSLIMGGLGNNGQCIELNQEEYQAIPFLNKNRFKAASTFIQNKIVIVGGDYEDSIEILDWDESNHGNHWIESPSKFQIRVSYHTMVTLNDKLFVIGGSVPAIGGSDRLDTIWEGAFDVQENRISWVELGLRLQKTRSMHFSFVISNQIIIFGGRGDGEDFVEIIFGNELKRGPKVPVNLDTVFDQAVLDRENRIIIVSRNHGLIVYDHQHQFFQHFPNLKPKDKRIQHATILQ